MNIASPRRVSHSHVQRLVAAPDRVFPLMCPVREADWLDGWDPSRVASRSGVAEPDCVFVTASGAHEAIWYITQHRPEAGFVEMLKVTPQVTACRLTIQLRAAAHGTDAEIAYTHTSLGPEGDDFVEAFTSAAWLEFMGNWERRLNHYLRHGTALREVAR